MNACGVRDGLSGDMLASSQRNLVLKGTHWTRVLFVDGIGTYNGERDVRLGV